MLWPSPNDLCTTDGQGLSQGPAQKIYWKGKCKKRGGEMSLERLAMGPDCPNPVTNHFALQVGGAGLAVLALRG